MKSQAPSTVDIGEYQHGFSFPDESVFKTRKGLDEEVVNAISSHKGEPEWMRQFRLRSLRAFQKKSMPNWGADLSDINFDELYYYAKPTDDQKKSWDDVPAYIKETFERIGIPEAERKFLAGVGAQYDSEMVYHSIKEDLSKKGVIFTDPESAVRDHPDLVKQYFGTVIPYLDNKFAALNSAVWSGGSFVYVPKGVKVDVPLQAYFRINAKSFGQFERTLIIADEGSFVHYIEGCTAPIYATESLHSAVVEIIALPGPCVRYTTIQNWSADVYNLVTKRAMAYKDATVEWVDGNIGSKRTMKYPSIYLMGEGAHGEVLSIAFAGKGQEQDTGGKAVHAASHTSSIITAKSISKGGGVASYRGLLKVNEGLHDVRSRVVCDALILDERSRSNTYPYMEINSDDVSIEHEARVSKISEEQLVLPPEPGHERGRGFHDDRQRVPGPAGQAASHGVRRGANRLIEAGDGGDGRLMADRKEPVWMQELRAKAQERFDGMSWPTTSDEEWRRTDVSGINALSFAPAPRANGVKPVIANADGVAGTLRFDAGLPVEAGISPAWKDRGVRLLSRRMPWRSSRNRSATFSMKGWTLRTTGSRCGTTPPGAIAFPRRWLEIPEPFLIDFTERGDGVLSAPHVVVVLGEGARASVIHRITGERGGAGERILCNAGLDLMLSDASALQYFEGQYLGPQSLYFRQARTRGGRDSLASPLRRGAGGQAREDAHSTAGLPGREARRS